MEKSKIDVFGKLRKPPNKSQRTKMGIKKGVKLRSQSQAKNYSRD